MKYKLIIDKDAEEEIIAVVHAPSALTQQIEDLVCNFSGADHIMGFKDDEMRKLSLLQVQVEAWSINPESQVEHLWSYLFPFL